MLGAFLALCSAATFALNNAFARRGVLTGSALQALAISVPIGVPMFLAGAIDQRQPRRLFRLLGQGVSLSGARRNPPFRMGPLLQLPRGEGDRIEPCRPAAGIERSHRAVSGGRAARRKPHGAQDPRHRARAVRPAGRRRNSQETGEESRRRRRSARSRRSMPKDISSPGCRRSAMAAAPSSSARDRCERTGREPCRRRRFPTPPPASLCCS